eukprot:15340471-Ditylum_brightwellii.AAC.2
MVPSASLNAALCIQIHYYGSGTFQPFEYGSTRSKGHFNLHNGLVTIIHQIAHFETVDLYNS